MSLAQTGDVDVVLTSDKLSLSSWPHAVIDCPSSWAAHSPSPCPSCYCFVCDAPFPACDDPVAHAPADGACDEWRRAKRRRAKLRDAWHDIPTLVNLIVQLSVDDAARNAAAAATHHPPVPNACGSPTYVGMIDTAFIPKADPDTLVKGLAAVSLHTEPTRPTLVVKNDPDAHLFQQADHDFVNHVNHVNHELLVHSVVKTEVASQVVHPAPE